MSKLIDSKMLQAKSRFYCESEDNMNQQRQSGVTRIKWDGQRETSWQACQCVSPSTKNSCLITAFPHPQLIAFLLTFFNSNLEQQLFFFLTPVLTGMSVGFFFLATFLATADTFGQKMAASSPPFYILKHLGIILKHTLYNLFFQIFFATTLSPFSPTVSFGP